MKRPRLIVLLAVALLALTGCSTISSRIDQKSEVFASLPADDQARLRRGEVAVGDTSDMVYIALGEPTRRRETITTDSARTEWIYRVYEENFEGSHFAGYRRVVGIDPRTGRRFIYLEPQYADVYSERAEDRLRIIFENGRVAVIEELKR